MYENDADGGVLMVSIEETTGGGKQMFYVDAECKAIERCAYHCR